MPHPDANIYHVDIYTQRTGDTEYHKCTGWLEVEDLLTRLLPTVGQISASIIQSLRQADADHEYQDNELETVYPYTQEYNGNVIKIEGPTLP